MPTSVPHYARAILSALRIRESAPEPFRGLSRADWAKALRFCDRNQLTLPLALRGSPDLPEEIRMRLDRNLRDNTLRWERIKDTYRRIATLFEGEGLEFAVLKGFSHCPMFAADPRWRTQYDIDLLLPGDQAKPAWRAAHGIGYQPIQDDDLRPTDHLPTLIRKTGWEWKEDFFDPEIPLSLELHYRLWDPETEGFGAGNASAFWERRENRCLEDLRFQALHPVDSLGYAALHWLRHLLRGDARLGHAYEIGRCLELRAHDEQFWARWREWHNADLRRLETICFCLSQKWFGGRVPAAVQEELQSLPQPVQRWIRIHGDSPVAGIFHPNKDEIWLHWCLIEYSKARRAMLRRRLLPSPPRWSGDAAHILESQITFRRRVLSGWRALRFVAGRAAHHASAMPSVAASALAWFTRYSDFEPGFWQFFIASGFHDFGLFIFFLLYNLYLLRLGLAEDVLGYVSAAMTAGSLAGCFPTAIAMRRFGIRKTLMGTFLLVALDCAFRASSASVPLLIGLAFVGGAFSSAWAVGLAPAIAQLANSSMRAPAFSLVFSAGIGIGAAAGIAGGRLPGWFERWGLARTPVGSYRAALLLASAIVLLALWPLRRVPLGPAVRERRATSAVEPQLLRFLAAIGIWYFATGIFNPFFTAFFARKGMAAANIGTMVAISQFAQATAVLAAPGCIRRFGTMTSIAGAQLLTGLTLAAVGLLSHAKAEAAAYIAYMVAQYATSPALYGHLMEMVPEQNRNRASALHFVVLFSTQAGAAALAGRAIARVGYAPVIIAAAALCWGASLILRLAAGQTQADAPALLSRQPDTG